MSLSMQALATFQRALQDAPELTDHELLVAATESTLLVEREVKELIPRGATGLTAASITSDVLSTPAGPLGVVGSTQPAALFVELGTRPHMPPVAPLVPWVRNVLGVPQDRARTVAYLVARKIAQRGTRAQRPFARALEATEAQIVRIFEDAADRLAAHLAGDGA